MNNLFDLSIKKAICITICFLSFLPFVANSQGFDDDKPTTTYNKEFIQSFEDPDSWDEAKFYDQWQTVQDRIFGASDIASGYLEFEWVPKRILISNLIYSFPYIIETDMDHSAGSNRAGVVIRANPVGLEDVQEPAEGDPGFNSEGIAFYPSEDGSSMIVQFTGAFVQWETPVTRILVPKPADVSSLMDRGLLRIEDFGSTIYAYYNELPFIRIDLENKIETIYTSGTVYQADMTVAGTFTDMEVEEEGKLSICQRDARLRLYNVKINSNQLTTQSISFDAIDNKYITDDPFDLSATATSGLPVEFTVVSGPAQIEESTLSFTGSIGIVTIAANQSGSPDYYPAEEVTRVFYVGDPDAANITANSQDYVDNWVVTDALGRQLPDYTEAGEKRENKIVGVFYYIWHGFHSQKVYDIPTIIANYPSDPLSASNTAWGGVSAFHFWGEPETGYHRAEDPWVLRRDLQMLSNAHVDFIYIDVTNAYIYLETVKKLCEVSVMMRAEGVYTPEIVFTTHASSGRIMNQLYDEFYSNNLFENLWFKWDGKPLILGDFTDTELRSEVKEFFTIKYCWAWTNTKTVPNHWQWLDTYPQDYGWSTDIAIPEQVPVSVAQHPMSTTGTSYHNGSEPLVNDEYLTDYTGQGLHFAEQWNRALKLDPSVIMVTQWNEWVAQRFIRDSGNGTYAGHPIKNGDSYFVDVFTEEFNRDMAPMKGGHTDNYYYQLISNVRKYKGMSIPQQYSTPVTINLDGEFSDWSNVLPSYKDPQGDVMHRNFPGYDTTVKYVNNTGRNDIIESKITYDEDNIYFYVKALNDISDYQDPNWMLLFIDADKDKETGWEGYEWMINKSITSSGETSLQKYNGNGWDEPVSVNYLSIGNELELSLSRALLNKADVVPEFYFKWADNPQNLDDISAFFTDGDAAPDRRFNFNFSPETQPTNLNDNNVGKGKISIYPNPAENVFYLETPGYSNIEIYSVTGKIIYSNTKVLDKCSVDVSNWNAGLYLVKIENEEKVYNRKLLVE